MSSRYNMEFYLNSETQAYIFWRADTTVPCT